MRSVVAEFRKGAKDYSDKEIESIVDDAVDAATLNQHRLDYDQCAHPYL